LDSFTGAAGALRTTQAAVSLKLKRLEEGLGARLVERTPGMSSIRGRALLSWSMRAHSWRRTNARCLLLLARDGSARRKSLSCQRVFARTRSMYT